MKQYKEFLNGFYSDPKQAATAANWVYREYQKNDVGVSLHEGKIIVSDEAKLIAVLQDKYPALQAVTPHIEAFSDERLDAIITEKITALQVQNNVIINNAPHVAPEIQTVADETQEKPIAMQAMQSNTMFTLLVLLSSIMSGITSHAALQTICSREFSVASSLLFAVTVPYFVFVVRNKNTVRIIARLDMLYLGDVCLKGIESTPEWLNITLQYLCVAATVFYIYTVIHGIFEGSKRYI